MIKINGVKINPKQFPDGTFCIHDLYVVSPESEKELYTIDWRWEDNPSEYILIYFIVNHLRDRFHIPHIQLVMPYIPDARMDRVKHNSEVFTLKYFAKFINSMGFDAVGVLDPHSDVSAGLFDRMYQINVMDFIADTIIRSNADLICFPDTGALKRYTNPNIKKFVYGEKDRDWDTGKIKGLTIHNPLQIPQEEFKNSHILIIDDICSKGGTFYFAGNALKELGVGQIDLYVTHCENAIFDGMLLGPNSPIDAIYTTDSVVRTAHHKIRVFKIGED